MSKQEFLARLREALSGLPPEEIEERLTFYSEMIDDRMEEGLGEAAAVAEIGPAEAVAAQILEEVPITSLVRERVRSKRRLAVWEIVLLVLGSPLWLSLLIAAFAVLLSVCAVIWSVILSLWAAELSLALSAPCAAAAGIVFLIRGESPRGLCLLASGLVLAGLAIFLFFGCLAASRGAVYLTKKIALGVKSLFLGKERRK